MKLLIISAAFPPMPSGESTNTLFLAKHLGSCGVDVHILTGKGNNYPSGTRLTVHPVMPDWSWSSLPKFISFLRTCSPDAILLMYIGWIYDHHPMITFAPTIAKRTLPLVRFITRFESVHGPYIPKYATIPIRVIRKAIIVLVTGVPVNYCYGTLLRDTDQIIVLSQEHRICLLEEDSTIDGKIKLIPPPPNMTILPEGESRHRGQVRKSLNIQGNETLLVYLGYIYPMKSFDTLLRAFRLILNSRRDVRLLVLGSGLKLALASPLTYEDEMHQLAKDLDIDDHIIWMGNYQSTDENASSWLRAADIGVLPFINGLQMNNSSFACAAAHSLPIISNHGKFTDEYLVHEQNVYLCPPQDHTALAAAIDRVLTDSDLRERLRFGVQKLADEWFSWPRAIERTLGTFGACLHSPSPYKERPDPGTGDVSLGKSPRDRTC